MRATLSRCLRCSSSLRTPRALTRLRDSPLSRYINISEEVKDALYRSLPVVSLETAITSHGLPYEQAISTASSLDEIIRVAGAVPAVVGVIDGKIKIGLDEKEIKRLAETSNKTGKWKIGKRDIAPALVAKVDGGTTVSATSFLSHLAGIDVFVTGGIGGVHRGAQQTMDISSDLTELGKTPTTVVCAGAKSILDIGLTLEYLETLGVTVTTFGHTRDFPAFYARQSGFQAPSNVNTAREAAELIYLNKILKTKTGTLIGVPIPEQYEEKSKRIQEAVEQAVRESEKNGIATRGKEVTPWILAKVKELSGGESVESNIALIENNARVGTAIAVELSRLVQSGGENQFSNARASSPRTAAMGRQYSTVANGHHGLHSTISDANAKRNANRKRLAVVGAAVVDIVSQPDTYTDLVPETTVPGTTQMRPGGVARNVHEAAFGLGCEDAVLIAPVGRKDDPLAYVLEQGLASLGASHDGLVRIEGETPSVNMLLNSRGTLDHGVAATRMVEEMAWLHVSEKLRQCSPDIVCFDGNISTELMNELVLHCKERHIISVFEPTSDAKACKLLRILDKATPAEHSGQPIVTHMAPNRQEILAMHEALTLSSGHHELRFDTSKASSTVPPWLQDPLLLKATSTGLAVAENLWLKAGSDGLCLFSRSASHTASGSSWVVGTLPDSEAVYATYFAPLHIEANNIKNGIGAGDSLLGGILAGLCHGLDMAKPAHVQALARIGQEAAVASLLSDNAIGDLQQGRRLLQNSRIEA